MRALKIALVCDWFLPRIGGIEINMKDLAKNLSARGHEVHVITALPGPEWVEDIRVHRLDVPVIPGLKLCYGKRTLSELERLFISENYDLIHGHYLLSTLAHISFLVARRMRIPTVFTHHSINGPLHNRVAFFMLPYLASMIGTLFFGVRASLQRIKPNRIAGVSHAVAADLQKIYRTNDVAVLPNGIDPLLWVQPKKKHSKFQITSVMRLCKSKHPMQLIRAIARINQRLTPQQRPIVHIIGDGSQRPKMERLIKRLGLEEQIKLLGTRPHKEIPFHLAQTDLFVLPSVREGFGLAVLEARTAGIPVVAMNHGGVSDIIRNGAEGFLTDTYQEFANRIAEYIQDEQLQKRFTKNVEEPPSDLTWDAVIARHLAVYEEAIVRYPERVPQLEGNDESLPDRRYGT